MPEPLVTPLDESTPAVAPEAPIAPEDATAPATDETSGISDDVLQIPAMQALMAGQPAALSAPIKGGESAERKAIINDKDALMGAGIGFYRSLSGDTVVLFNQLYVHPEEIKAADKAGKLASLAPPFDKVNHAVSKMGPDEHPAFTKDPSTVPSGPKGLPMPATPQIGASPSPAPPGGGQQRQMLAARLMNLAPQPATAGPVAGQGNLLKSILRPVI